jgi:hypothetical protein
MVWIFLDDEIFMKAFASGISKIGTLGSGLFSLLNLICFVGFEVGFLTWLSGGLILFILVTPHSPEGDSDVSLESTTVIGWFGWISLIVSPFQNWNGWKGGQNLAQQSNLVKASLGLSFPSGWGRGF